MLQVRHLHEGAKEIYARVMESALRTLTASFPLEFGRFRSGALKLLLAQLMILDS